MTKTLRLVLGDQISGQRLASLRDLDPRTDTVLMVEAAAETGYVAHHKQKIAMIFAAMRSFAARLRADGIDVRYVAHDEASHTGTLTGELHRALAPGQYGRAVVTAPGEWRLMQEFEAYAPSAPVPFTILEDDRFLCSRAEFAEWARGKTQLRMEFFYRVMRQRFGILLDAAKGPEGGAWNFDAENRKALPKNLAPPPRAFITPAATARQAIDDVERWFPDHFGATDAFIYAITPEEAETLVDRFLRDILPGFGDYQDAMARGEPFLWHAVLSAALNLGLIDALALCRRAEAEYREGRAPLNAVEGFIRQILGWREFVRGLYWLKMPGYKALNALGANRALPDFYWTGKTDMLCVRETVTATRDYAYAHHIQRLMVTGNLAMLLGVHPVAINEWYLAVYADAYEWVELPNTHGMATFADGGIMGSKPYAASGAYIARMSDYCRHCAYDVKQKLGERACPFNALYWDFLIRNEKVLGKNVRMAMPYKNLARMSESQIADIQAQAEQTKSRFGAHEANAKTARYRPSRGH